jgi:hypothetical protein
LAGFDAVELAVKAVQQAKTLGRLQVAFIGEIIRFSCKAVNQPHGTPEARGHQDGSDREILVVIDCHLVAKTSILNNNLRNKSVEDGKHCGVSLKWRVYYNRSVAMEVPGLQLCGIAAGC